MPAARSRVTTEESKTTSFLGREKHEKSHTSSSSRAKKAGQHGTEAGNSSKADIAFSNQALASANNLNGANNSNEGSKLSWISEDHSTLQAYRNAYRINSPSAFKLPLSHVILAQSAIGRQSPTFARLKSRRRVSKEQLALTIRKNFNALAVNENDVVANLLYTVRSQDTSFKMRFAPLRTR